MNVERRSYRMKARADAAADTHRRILEAAIRQFGSRYYDDVTLADVAREAGVTVQTVLRGFGSKEELTDAAAELGTAAVRDSRWSSVQPGDLRSAIASLVEHYEEWGARSLLFLAQEHRVPAMERVVATGRQVHRQWVEFAFAPWLVQSGGDGRLLWAKLVALTDVYVWKVSRQDLGFSAGETERLIREIVAATLTEAPTR